MKNRRMNRGSFTRAKGSDVQNSKLAAEPLNGGQEYGRPILNSVRLSPIYAQAPKFVLPEIELTAKGLSQLCDVLGAGDARIFRFLVLQADPAAVADVVEHLG